MKDVIVVAPNANTSDIQLQYHGVNPVLKDDNLRIDIGFNTIIEQKPIAYQMINGKRNQKASELSE